MRPELVKLKRGCMEQEALGEIRSPYEVSITFRDKPGYKKVSCDTLKKVFKTAGRNDVSGLYICDADGKQLVNVWSVHNYVYKKS